ncbi:uncharacterized protein LOC131652754 [Vicia villosa]|uniref:uncharacterized protein LOC131652754 n=1 Tax=Vicia villosa TaxID=3911 RepID=UPI00273B3667|nr:uncharacterized protein LOC131652754 [Vicia villosa]
MHLLSISKLLFLLVPVSAVSRETISMIASEAMSSTKVKDWSLLDDLPVFFERQWCLRPTVHSSIRIWSKHISLVVMNLEIVTGCLVLESGTGSGSVTTSFARAVAPK